MSHPPTAEQQAAIDITVAGDSCVIEALAGTGKTSTLQMAAEATPTRRIQFVAFNKAIVNDAAGRFPDHVNCSTAHSLAFRAVGRNYAHRLNGNRMKSYEIAKRLDIRSFDCTVDGFTKHLSGGFLGGLVKRAIDTFCQTDDREPGARHLPIVPGLDAPRLIETSDGAKLINTRGMNHIALAAHLAPAIARYWADIVNTNGTLPYSHGHYLKQWELAAPRINADTILLDEAQDANPCLLSVIDQQTDAQIVVVGDTFQQIYGWNGAINALERAAPEAPRTWLTRSFRFGPEIAERANRVLRELGAPVRVEGGGPHGLVAPIVEPRVVLSRTNARAVATALQELRAGRRVAIVGGADDVVNFARSAEALKQGRTAWHPDLACFSSWAEVQDYVDHDPSGSELQLLVKLVDDFGADVIVAELSRCTDEGRAELILSTAHKAKGREWEAVQLAGDFPDPEKRELGDEELRLLYVAATRPQYHLDVEAVGFFTPKKERV